MNHNLLDKVFPSDQLASDEQTEHFLDGCIAIASVARIAGTLRESPLGVSDDTLVEGAYDQEAYPVTT